MVDTSAARVAILVGGAALLFLFVGQVLRRLSWMFSWAILAFLVLALAYVVYELWSGWNAAEKGRERSSTPDSLGDHRSLEQVKDRYASDELSEDELEAELEQLVETESSEVERR